LTDKILDEISGSYGGEFKMIVFWDVAPCSLVDINRIFRGAYCLNRRFLNVLKLTLIEISRRI
jgi:hypothetical protein